MKTFSLSIQSPCSEKWENFTHTAQGGFCKTCNNTVIDFTKMSAEEIAIYFASKPSHTCGRFRTEQLRVYRMTMPPRINPGLTLLKAGLLGLLVSIISRPAMAQSTLGEPKIETEQYHEPQAMQKASSKPHHVQGVVTADGLPIPGINILWKGTTTGMITDFNGAFEFPDSLKNGDVLIFSFIGYQTMEYQIADSTPATIQIDMVPDIETPTEVVWMGAVAVTEPYQDNVAGLRKLWRGIKRIF